MNTNSNIDKIDKVLSKISGKELKSFVSTYAANHNDFATALVEKYWKPERGNYKDKVDACFVHLKVSGRRVGGPTLDWRMIEKDLQTVMRKAVSMKKKGYLIDAAIIAGYLMTTTCSEFERDHKNYTPARYDLWAEENKVLKGIVNQAENMVKELLIQSDEIEDDSRLGMLGDIVKRCEEIGSSYFMNFEWFVDEAMPLLCGDDEKAYMAFITNRQKNSKDKYFLYRYDIQKADYWLAHGKRSQAEKLMMEKRDNENIRDHYIDCLIDLKDYRKAIEIIDDNTDDFKAYSNKWEDKTVKALKLSGDKEWLIEECKKRIITSGYKLKYYEALKEAVPTEEWQDFLRQLWDEVDWEHDYEEAEAQIVIKEKMFDRMKMVFVHHSWNLWEMFVKYIKYVPKKDQAFVGELMSKKICHLALLKEKPKEFAWLLGEVQRMMRHSRIADEVIKEGIRNLIKEHPKNYYLKNYLGCVL